MSGYSGPAGQTTRRRARARKVSTMEKSVGYSATVNDTLLEISKSTSATETSSEDIKTVRVANVGKAAAVAIFKYQRWTDEDTVGAVSYMHYLLAPKESVSVPAMRAIMTDDSDLYEGDAVDNTAPNSALEVDSGTTLAENVEDSDTEFNVTDGSYFRVGDHIQLGINNTTVTRIEVMKILTITDTAGDGDYTPSNITVERALFGTSAADKDAQTNGTSGAVSGAKVYFPIFNQRHDYDKFTVVQTDDRGRYQSTNFFGYGRAATFLSGVTPGSVAIKFYSKGVAKIGLSDISGNTETGLVASTTYYIKVAVDGGTAQEISFTTDASNSTFGGSTGVIAKIQNALDTGYYTSTSDLFQKKVECFLAGGDIVFQSGSKLSTSAIALTVGVSGASDAVRLLTQQNGRIPILAGIPAAIGARLEEDKTYDPITYSASFKDIFIKDDGNGQLIYRAQNVGFINYETGELSWELNSCPNAEFVISVLHSGPFSGKQDATDAEKINSLIAVYGNTPQQKATTSLRIETF